VASGPSLTPADVDYCRGKVDLAIAINTSYQMVPWATALYAADAHWWGWHKGAKDFGGLRYSLSPDAAKYGVSILRNTGQGGLEMSPDGLKTGRNSGYQAVNLAVHFGAKRIILLGYDLQPSKQREHWHPDHPHSRPSPYSAFRDAFKLLVGPLASLGVEVVNCTPATALTCFPRRPLREALPDPGHTRPVLPLHGSSRVAAGGL
jgi:hypothetical protein